MTDEPRIRILAVTDDAQLLSELGNDAHVELVAARRPAETVRRFEADPPDVVIIELSERPQRQALLVDALCERPLGALVPIFLLDRRGVAGDHPLTTPDGAREAGAERFFPHGTPTLAVVSAAARMLGLSVDLPEPEGPTTSPAPQPASPPPQVQRRPSARKERGASGRAEVPEPSDAEGAPSPEVIRLKLRQARHEDYFTLLEVRKSADPARIRQSYKKLRGRFDHNRLPRGLADRHFNDLAELCDALDDAYGVLGDEALRKRYLRAILDEAG